MLDGFLETVALTVLRGTLGRLLNPSFKPHPSEEQHGRIGEERGLFPREKLERVHLETREVDIDPISSYVQARTARGNVSI